MKYDRSYLIWLMETCVFNRAETAKSSLNNRRFTGYANLSDGPVRVDANYTVYPQYIIIDEVVITRGFDKHVERFVDFVIKKDSDLGEYLLH